MEKKSIWGTPALLSLLLVAVMALAACGGGLETVPQAGVEAGQEGVGVVTDADADVDVDAVVVTDGDVATDTETVVVDAAAQVPESSVETMTETGTEIVTDTIVVTAVTDIVTDVTIIEEVSSDVEVITEDADLDVDGAGVTVTESSAAVVASADANASATAFRAGAGASGASGVLVTASSLNGYNFDDMNGEGVGSVGSIILDPQTGQIQYLVVDYGGFLTLGQSQIPVPLNAFSMMEGDRLVANFDQNALDQYPATDDNWQDSDTWQTDAANFWSGLGFGEAAYGDTATPATAGASQFVRAADIIGRQAALATEADDMRSSGNIEDLLLDLQNGYAKYLLVDVLDIEVDGLYVLPFNALNFVQVGDSYALNSDFDRNWLTDAPVTNRAFLTDPTTDPNIAANNDAYWGERGFFSGWGVNQ